MTDATNPTPTETPVAPAQTMAPINPDPLPPTPPTPVTITPAPAPTPPKSFLKAGILIALALGMLGWAIARHHGYGAKPVAPSHVTPITQPAAPPMSVVSPAAEVAPEPTKAAKKATPATTAQVAAAATTSVRATTVTAYNGLLYAEMGTLVADLEKKGAKVRTLWHDEQWGDTSCPDYIIGHSMGGNAALRQAVKCQAAGHPPKAIVSIDAGRAPLTWVVPDEARYACFSYYNSAHPIGGQYIGGKCKNTVVTGYIHLYMPAAPIIVKGVLAIVFPPK